uniref:Lysoplasmalogenase n=1 Tax=Streptomyces sp. NBC_00003 TaxID=2903608 RepID=A0AAU2VCH6_9ACTN
MTQPGADAVPRGPATKAATITPLLVAFGLASAVDLLSLLAGWHTGHLVAKPLLMPLLAGHVYARGGPRLLVAALLCGWGGDVFLLSGADAAFLLGMGCFAAGHVCYLVLFGRGRTHAGLGRVRRILSGTRGPGTPICRVVVNRRRSASPQSSALQLDAPDPRSPAPNGQRRLWATRSAGHTLGAAYGIALVGTVAALWPDLPGGLRVPVAGYSLLLTAMAYRSSRLGPLVGLGGALFLLSDTLIATGVADWPQPPRPAFCVMLTYLAAQALLAQAYRERPRTSP